MDYRCPNCNRQYAVKSVDVYKLKQKNIQITFKGELRIKCDRCQNWFTVKPKEFVTS